MNHSPQIDIVLNPSGTGQTCEVSTAGAVECLPGKHTEGYCISEQWYAVSPGRFCLSANLRSVCPGDVVVDVYAGEDLGLLTSTEAPYALFWMKMELEFNVSVACRIEPRIYWRGHDFFLFRDVNLVQNHVGGY